MRTHYLGLAFLAVGYLTLTGCDPEVKTDAPAGGTTAGGGDEHDHEHDHALGPNGGDIIELGDEAYHAELVHKKKSSLVAVYLLDGEMKNAVPIEAQGITLNLTVEGNPAQYKLAAAPLEGEADGQSSRFELDDAILADLLSSSDEVTGRLNVTIAGTDYVGEIDHHGHDHAHDHGEEGHEHAEGDEGHDHEDHDHAEGEDHEHGDEDHDHAEGDDAT